MSDKKTPTREIFNAKTQKVEEAQLYVDNNNEIVATFEDGSFVKFPIGMTAKEFESAIAAHQEANHGQEVVTPEIEAQRVKDRAASEALINGSTEDTTSGEDQSNEPAAPAAPETPSAQQ